MPAEGVEPTRPCGQRILSPSRLPIPPRRLVPNPRNLQTARRIIQQLFRGNVPFFCLDHCLAVFQLFPYLHTCHEGDDFFMNRAQISALLMVMGVVCACSKPPPLQPVPPMPPTPSTGGDWSTRDVSSVEAAAVAGVAAAQREWAGRLLFGRGVPQDLSAALEWTEKAAHGGDAQAAVWMGRKFLGEQDRVRAAAWFLVAAESSQPGAAQDAHAELDALAPASEEFSTARALAKEWKQNLIRPPAGESK